VVSVAWSPDGKRLASAALDGAVQIWDAEAGRQTLSLMASNLGVWSVAWSPDGKHLAAGISNVSDQTILLWDADMDGER
jgi:WD40 repeat protein